MSKDYAKLRESLSTIKEECRSHGTSCGSCPFCYDVWTCGITGQRMAGNYDYRIKPMYWSLPSIQLMIKPDDVG